MVLQAGESQLEGLQMVLKDARLHAAGLEADKHRLEHALQKTQQALAEVACSLHCSPLLPQTSSV